MNTQFERDYDLFRDLTISTALAYLVPKGFVGKGLTILSLGILAIIGWHVITGPATPPPLSMMKVQKGEIVEGLEYHVAAPNGDGMQSVEFRNNRGVRVANVMFQCESPMAGSYELMLHQTYEPHTSGVETAMGQTSDSRATCWLKSYETYQPKN